MTSSDRIASSEITPASVYFNRRAFMNAGITAVSLVATGKVYRALNHPGAETIRTPELAPSKDNAQSETGRISRGLLGDDEPLTPLKNITNYNNFYEFTTDKETVSAAAARFVARPWEISVEGMVHKPGVFGLDDILKTFPVEERVYRMRCVEGWSMVIPWSGFSLSKLLERVEPLGGAKYVAFESLFDPKRMPNQESAVLPWPYVEGLRMDEAMHPLTILAVGLYGHELPPQNGAPLRLVVPWKYGFKGIKSIVKIRVVAERPASTWNITGPREYGFYSNVNPEVDHPRWSQATEQRIGEIGRRPTLLFNGYGSQVAHLYTGMDLRKNY